MRRIHLLFVLLIGLVAHPAITHAESGPTEGFDPFGTRTSVSVNVTSTPSGVYVQVTVTQTTSGSTKVSDSSSKPAPTPVASSPSSGQTGAPASPSEPQGTRIWSDPTGIYEQTADGNLLYLTVPNISSQGDWPALLQQNPGKTPYVLYLNGQLQGFIWIPNTTDSQTLQFGAPPAATPIPGNPPPGNGASTNPYQVALSLLDRVPLPGIQIKENPALGLVNLPGWFWIDGYDGKPFGTSQTVTIPPAVGPSVPFTEVPADDPRRQSTSFTVSVKIWATSYQWGFGDGATLVTQSLGQAYPAQSDIAHTYSYSSLKTQEGFPVQVAVVFAAQYQVNGGAPQGLPSMSHTYTTTYPVQEAQSLLTSN